MDKVTPFVNTNPKTVTMTLFEYHEMERKIEDLEDTIKTMKSTPKHAVWDQTAKHIQNFEAQATEQQNSLTVNHQKNGEYWFDQYIHWRNEHDKLLIKHTRGKGLQDQTEAIKYVSTLRIHKVEVPDIKVSELADIVWAGFGVLGFFSSISWLYSWLS